MSTLLSKSSNKFSTKDLQYFKIHPNVQPRTKKQPQSNITLTFTNFQEQFHKTIQICKSIRTTTFELIQTSTKYLNHITPTDEMH